MRMRVIHYITMTIAILLLTCCKVDEPTPPTLPLEAHRTIIVYMMGDNDLSSAYDFDVQNINDMKEGMKAVDNGGRLVILYHTNKKEDVYLLEIARRNANEVVVDTLKRYTDFVTTNPDCMREAIYDVHSYAPAPEYGIIFWSHATGWLPQNTFYKAPASIGTEGKDNLTIDIDVLGEALSPFHFDFILFDACLMGSIEVAYQLRNVCNYMIASPTESMGAGYPYKSIIPQLLASTINYTSVCQEFSSLYIDAANNGTIALVDMQHIEKVADVCRTIVCGREADIANLSLAKIQYYDRKTPHVFYDLRHYMAQLADSTQLTTLDEAMQQAIPYKNASSRFINIPINHYSGMSSYILQSSKSERVETYYHKLQWYDRIYKR